MAASIKVRTIWSLRLCPIQHQRCSDYRSERQTLQERIGEKSIHNESVGFTWHWSVRIRIVAQTAGVIPQVWSLMRDAGCLRYRIQKRSLSALGWPHSALRWHFQHWRFDTRVSRWLSQQKTETVTTTCLQVASFFVTGFCKWQSWLSGTHTAEGRGPTSLCVDMLCWLKVWCLSADKSIYDQRECLLP